jgi:hypothetical protein
MASFLHDMKELIRNSEIQLRRDIQAEKNVEALGTMDEGIETADNVVITASLRASGLPQRIQAVKARIASQINTEMKRYIHENPTTTRMYKALERGENILADLGPVQRRIFKHLNGGRDYRRITKRTRGSIRTGELLPTGDDLLLEGQEPPVTTEPLFEGETVDPGDLLTGDTVAQEFVDEEWWDTIDLSNTLTDGDIAAMAAQTETEALAVGEETALLSEELSAEATEAIGAASKSGGLVGAAVGSAVYASTVILRGIAGQDIGTVLVDDMEEFAGQAAIASIPGGQLYLLGKAVYDIATNWDGFKHGIETFVHNIQDNVEGIDAIAA